MNTARRTLIKYISDYEFELLLFIYLTVKLFKHNISLANSVNILPRYAAIMAIIAVFSCLVGGVLRRSEKALRDTLIVIVSLAAVSYMPNSALLLDIWFRNADVYRVFPALLLCAAAPSIIDKHRLKWLLPPLAFVSASALPVYIFTYFPFLWVLIRYARAKAAQGNEYNDLSASTVIASFLGFLLFGIKKVFLDAVDIPKILDFNIKTFVFSVVAVLPLVILLGAFWIICAKSTDNKALRRVFLLAACLPLCGILWVIWDNAPVHPLMTTVFAQIGLLLVAVNARDGTVVCALERLQKACASKWFVLFLVLLCAVYLSLFTGYAKEIFAGYTQSKTYFSLWG